MDRILARAIELEAASEGHLTDDQLRDIAAEVGISTEAIDRALAETRPVSAQAPAHWVVDDAARAAGMGLALGVLTSLVRPMAQVGNVHVESLIAFAIMAAALARLARKASGPSPQVRYHAGSGAMWVGFAAGFILLFGKLQGDVLLVTGCGALISSVIGGILVRLGPAGAPPSLPPAPESGHRSPVSVRYGWVSRWFRQLFHSEASEHAHTTRGFELGGLRPWRSADVAGVPSATAS